MSEAVVPHSFSEAAAALAGAAAQGRPLRIVGGATKLGWGGSTPPRALRLHTGHLSRVVVHQGGATATINAGTPLVRAQGMLARDGMMFAVDPQLGLGHQPLATVGGVVATADSGPLSHRYGPPREQIIGITGALGDGSLIRTGPRTDHVQDGFDVARLLIGSYGTLGVILAVDVRLHPLPGETATAMATSADPRQLRDAVEAIVHAHPGLEAFDLAWRAGRGGLLVQVAGDSAEARAREVAATMSVAGLDAAAVTADDAGLWARQRAGQRSADHAVLRVSHQHAELDSILRLADAADATVVGRAARGPLYLTLTATEIARVRSGLPPGCFATALDLPATARGAIAPWDLADGPELGLMRDIKSQLDPAGVCNPGVFVGSI
jgi:glycolate oxidase FAD binding subunit